MSKIIKKIAGLVLTAFLVLSVCACGVAPEPEKEETSTSATTVSNIVRVTFPEGFTAADIAKRLEEYSVCTCDEFIQAVNDPANLSRFGIEIDSPGERAFLLEGYLFPDTYDFYIGEKLESVIKKFADNFNAQITEEMLARAAELGYTPDEIITIASIIQEEAGDPDEMPKVSAVLHNRLSSPEFSKLQCDACSFYLKNSVMPYVSQEDYEHFQQTYSTYNCTGLPEGPITNPGIDAVKAALYPDEHEYYFFVTDDNGVYHYAETYSEHLENCKLAGIE